jgi:hypothetical protein
MQSLTSEIPGTFAHVTISQRLPEILRLAIEQNRHESPALIMKLEQLLKELIELKPFSLIQDTLETFVWNDYIIELTKKHQNDWLKSSWLFSECYFVIFIEIDA